MIPNYFSPVEACEEILFQFKCDSLLSPTRSLIISALLGCWCEKRRQATPAFIKEPHPASSFNTSAFTLASFKRPTHALALTNLPRQWIKERISYVKKNSASPFRHHLPGEGHSSELALPKKSKLKKKIRRLVCARDAFRARYIGGII